MRGAVLLACVAACLGACGRIGFTDRSDSVGGGDGGGDSAAGDGSAAAMWTHVVAYADSTCAARAGSVFAIGYDHACATLADGSLWCWGRGDLGQLGDDKGTSSLTPVQVSGT